MNLVHLGRTSQLRIKEFTPETYQEFLACKLLPRYEIRYDENEDTWIIEFPSEYAERLGDDYKVTPDPMPLSLPDFLFDRQKVGIKIAWHKERYALLWDAGLGKTPTILELARQGAANGLKCLIVSPLNVIPQTMEMALEFYGSNFPHIINLHSRLEKGGELSSIKEFVESEFNIAIVNHSFFVEKRDLTGIDMILLDESSILKNGAGVLSKNLRRCTRGIRYKYAFSATQSPNERVEYARLAEYLEVVRNENEFIGMFFIQKDTSKTGTNSPWALRKHCERRFYDFLASFSMFMCNPAAYGFEDNRGLVPYQEIEQEIQVTDAQKKAIAEETEQAQLSFAIAPNKPRSFQDRSLYKQISRGFVYGENQDVAYRIETNKPKAIRDFIAQHPGKKVLVCTEFDEEGQILAETLSEWRVAEISGKTPISQRTEILTDFRHGKYDILISKPQLIGLGLNLHVASIVIFSGITDSFEAFYQFVKRAWRYPQKEQVLVYLPFTAYEAEVLHNVLRKRDQYLEDFQEQERRYVESGLTEIQAYLKSEFVPVSRKEKDLMHSPVITEDYELYHTDSIESTLNGLKANSIDLIVTSIPFRNDLFAYTDHVGDMGNSGGVGEAGRDEFIMHLTYCLKGMYTALMAGRIACIEISQSPLRLGVDGVIGMSDFRGDVIRVAEKIGFIQHGEWPIVDNPQAAAIVKHITTLDMNALLKDRTRNAPMLNDYIILLRKPGENETPINSDEVSNENWIEYADGVAQETEFNRNATMSTSIGQRERFQTTERAYAEQYDKLKAFIKLAEKQIASGELTKEELMMQFMGTMYDISQSDTLNTPYTRGVTKDIENSDKHTCPMSLQLVNRLIRMYSNSGETVLDPFMGIGTTAHEAIKLNRKVVGMELKAEYFLQSVEIAEEACNNRYQQARLF